MSNQILIKRSSTPGKVPSTTDLAAGELGMNTNDGKLFMLKAGTSIIDLTALVATGDVTGSGSAQAITLTLANSGVTAGTYFKTTVDTKGRVTVGTNPTTLSGFGITDAINVSQIGVASGVASLDSGGKLPSAQLPSSITGAMVYQGTWNASTNTPALASGTGTKGYYYKVSVAGTTVIDGNSQWNVGDQVAFDGTTWDKIDGISSEVLSVAGRTGAVALAQADISGLTTGSSPSFLSLTSTVAIGTAPLTVTSTTTVANLSADMVDGYQTATSATASTIAVRDSSGNLAGNILGNAATVTTNANLSGDVTSVGNVTTLSSAGTAGTYCVVTTDAKGRVTSGSTTIDGGSY